jgi:hypothetical protein
MMILSTWAMSFHYTYRPTFQVSEHTVSARSTGLPVGMSEGCGLAPAGKSRGVWYASGRGRWLPVAPHPGLSLSIYLGMAPFVILLGMIPSGDPGPPALPVETNLNLMIWPMPVAPPPPAPPPLGSRAPAR